MPGFSFSLPSGPACPYKVTGPGSICGSCYAEKGNYLYSNVKNTLLARFKWTVRATMSASAREDWIRTMTDAIGTLVDPADPYFRIHDSGDFFNPAYVLMWAEVIRSLPSIRFWVPTRSYRATAPAWVSAFQTLNALPNVTVRPSALYFNDPAPVVIGFSAGSTATTAGHSCPAPSQGNACGSCRSCWNDKATPISYHKH